MEQFIQAFLGTLTGAGIGGLIVYLAFQKAVENIVKEQLKPVWNRIDEFKNDYLTKELFKVYNESGAKCLDKIEESIKELNQKFDKYLLCKIEG